MRIPRLTGIQTICDNCGVIMAPGADNPGMDYCYTCRCARIELIRQSMGDVYPEPEQPKPAA